MSDDTGGDRPWTERKILEAIEDAREATAEFQAAKMHAAWEDPERNPYEHPHVGRARWEMHVKTMLAFKRIRPQIREFLAPEYWQEVWLYRDDQGRAIRGLKSLEVLQKRVYPKTVTEEDYHKGQQTSTQWEVELLPVEFYDRVIDLFGDAVVELGYVTPPSEPKEVADLNDPGDGDLPDGVPLSSRLKKEQRENGEEAAAETAEVGDGD